MSLAIGSTAAILIAIGPATSDVGFLLLLLVPLPASIVAAHFVRAIDAALIAFLAAFFSWLPLTPMMGIEALGGFFFVIFYAVIEIPLGASIGALLRSRRRPDD